MSCKRVESRCWAVPAQLIHVVKERDVGAERGQCPKKHCTVPFAAKRPCEGARVGGVYTPLAAIARDGFEMNELGKHSRRGLCAPAREAWIFICRIAHQRQIVGDGRRRDTELLDHCGLVLR